MKRQRKTKCPTQDKFYDILDDYALIESSFAQQYGIRLRQEEEMSADEFVTLLGGLMPESPLGQIISIRSEENRDVLEHFTSAQHNIRNSWRVKMLDEASKKMSEEDKRVQLELLQKAFSEAFKKE